MNVSVKYLKRNGLYLFRAKPHIWDYSYIGRFNGEAVEILWSESKLVPKFVIHYFDTHIITSITNCYLLALQL